MSDLISIVLPVYNGAKYLRESIDSVLGQTYQNWELLILDDCSTDQTPEIAMEYVNRDSRIHYHKNEQNLRLPGNLNRGFSLAKGDYLTWTSDDNRYRPTALEQMHRALQKHPTAQFAYASCRIIDDKGKNVEYIMVYPGSEREIVGANVVGACFLYTREVYETIGEYDTGLLLVEDYDYWQRIFMRFETVAIEDILYEYRWHDGALTSTMRKDQFNANLEKMLLKNVSGFGKLSLYQKYYFYRGLYVCRKNLGDHPNPYEWQYRPLRLWYYWTHQVPAGLRRRIKKLTASSSEEIL